MNFFHSIPIPEGFDVSWAGAGFDPDGFCFGSVDGHLRFTNSEGSATLPFDDSLVHDHTVNDLVITRTVDGTTIAVGARDQLTIFQYDRSTEKILASPIPMGVHGVTATRSGLIVAPMGPAGLLTTRPVYGQHLSTTIRQPGSTLVNFYKAINLESPDGADFIVCAARKSGIVIGANIEAEGEFTSLSYPGADIVDVEALQSPDHPFATVVLSKDGSFALYKDILSETQRRVRVRLPGISGVAYRICSARGHLLLLTSEGIFIFPDLIKMFNADQPVESLPVSVLSWSVEAVDINIVRDRWILLVLPHAIWRADLEQLDNLDLIDVAGDKNGMVYGSVPYLTSLEVEKETTNQQPTREKYPIASILASVY